jgi:hypothetical protein
MYLYENGDSTKTLNIGKAIAAIIELRETYLETHKVKTNTATAPNVSIGIIYK